MMETFGPRPRLSFRTGRWQSGDRALPAETPVALVYNGTTQAVMMASPADLDDFAAGFSITEQIVTNISEILEIETIESGGGIELRIWLSTAAEDRFQKRRRAQVGPVGCGLCGIDSLAEALRPLPAVVSELSLGAEDVAAAMSGLERSQALNQVTRAVHGAGFYVPGQGLTAAREDVGRHNALDKLAGALASRGVAAATGAIVLSSRLSVDLVQKAAVIGAPVLMSVSVPTDLAVATAEAAGISLVAVVRDTDFEIFTHPHRFAQGLNAHVA